MTGHAFFQKGLFSCNQSQQNVCETACHVGHCKPTMWIDCNCCSAPFCLAHDTYAQWWIQHHSTLWCGTLYQCDWIAKRHLEQSSKVVKTSAVVSSTTSRVKRHMMMMFLWVKTLSYLRRSTGKSCKQDFASIKISKAHFKSGFFNDEHCKHGLCKSATWTDEFHLRLTLQIDNWSCPALTSHLLIHWILNIVSWTFDYYIDMHTIFWATYCRPGKPVLWLSPRVYQVSLLSCSCWLQDEYDVVLRVWAKYLKR